MTARVSPRAEAPPGTTPEQLQLSIAGEASLLLKPTRKPQMCRYTAILDKADQQALEYYLHRTGMYWNLMLSMIKEPVEDYLASPGETQDFSVFCGRLMTIHVKIMEDTSFHLEDSWATYLPKIRELPASVTFQRFVDLVTAYEKAHTAKNPTSQNAGLPQRKSEKSSQSVRFSASEYEINGTSVRVEGPKPFTLMLGSPVRDLDPEKQYTLSITRPRIPLDAEGPYGPVSAERTYTATFLEIVPRY